MKIKIKYSMEDWKKYVETKKTEGASEAKPSTGQYLILKIADNSLKIAVFILCLVFAICGLFFITDTEKVNWSLHASGLCLGVFLGLLSSKKG
ncbi:MAG: hypothetical protein A3K10_01185 [Bacteroidetes bacterium RIFCSPLOWO2_12_FULL_31_6]|nr:MAG: hypothetical protein A3K10_01185 [Bacteroidetes bacterium RIFCSPLOWO2_12_FULL_31_6]